MAARYSWLEVSDGAIANQIHTVGVNMAAPVFVEMLEIAPDETATWQAHAAELLWLQNTAIPDADALRKSLVAARDGLMMGVSGADYERPIWRAFAAPIVPDGVTLSGGFFEWANLLVRGWKLNPAFTPSFQRQLGLLARGANDAQIAAQTPRVRGVKSHSGGVVEVTVFKGNAAGIIVQLNVDGAGWPDVNVGGAYQKMAMSSRVTFGVPPETAHALQIRTAFCDRFGRMVGNWSDVYSASSLA